MSFDHTVTIDAPIDVVWAVTVDVENLPAVTPTISGVERLDDGPLRVGSRVRLRQPRLPANVWEVEQLVEPNLFVWATGLGPFRLTAAHELEAVGSTCRNRLAVSIEGPAAGLVRRLAKKKMLDTLASENQGIKAAAESAR